MLTSESEKERNKTGYICVHNFYVEVRTAIKTKPLTKTHSTSLKAGTVDPGQADCNKTISSSGQTQPSPGQGLHSQG